MALVVEDGTGLDDAESYASVARLLAYFGTERGAASEYATLTAASTATHEALLRWATRLLDRLWLWDGERATTTQALRFPRAGLYDLDGEELASTALPAALVEATCELARALFDDAARADDQQQGLAEITAGAVKVVFDRYDRADVLPGIVVDLLSALGVPRGGGRSVRYLERG